MEQPFVAAIIVAAGASSRMGGQGSKLLLPLGGKPVLAHTLSAFCRCQTVREIIVVARPEEHAAFAQIAAQVGLPCRFAGGGETRQESVANGAAAACPTAEYLAVHDGARPLVEPAEIDRVARDAFAHRAAALGVRVKDTIKVVDEAGNIVSTPDRGGLWAVQTPQVVECALYLRALMEARQQNRIFTDECGMVEALGIQPHLTPGSYRNIKITTPEDLAAAAALLHTQ